MEETEHGIDAGVKRWLLLAIIGVCILLVYDILVMASGMGWIPQDVLISLFLLIEILSISGLILVAMGFHALYSIYDRALSRIAFFGFIIAPILLVMRILPPFFGNIWVSLAASLILFACVHPRHNWSIGRCDCLHLRWRSFPDFGHSTCNDDPNRWPLSYVDFCRCNICLDLLQRPRHHKVTGSNIPWAGKKEMEDRLPLSQQ
jgi:hypothetical protein